MKIDPPDPPEKDRRSRCSFRRSRWRGWWGDLGESRRDVPGFGYPRIQWRPALSLVYQAALQAATAVVRAAGYRVRGAGHHHHTFAAVAALDPGDLSIAARALDQARQMRHEAVYGWQARGRVRIWPRFAPIPPGSSPARTHG